MTGANPAAAMDSRAAIPRAASASTESAAPTVKIGKVHPTPQANDALVNPVNAASAVKQTAPQPVTRSNSTDVGHATAAPSNELAADGPRGSARKPPAAANTTALLLSATQRIGSG